jgi:carbon-monoxide dehydrogenase medium subunit
MYRFEYQQAQDIADAVKRREKAEDGVYLAGGMTLVPTLRQRLAAPSDLIDLAGIDALKGIEEDGGSLRIGAMESHADVAASELVRDRIPALSSLAAGIGDPQVRNRGTLGGSVANADPAADYPAAVLGLGATIHTDRRTIEADDFFRGLFETALEEGELITAIEFPVPRRASYHKFKNPVSRYAIVGVFVADFGAAVRLAVTGAAVCVFRVPEMEAALSEAFLPQSITGITVDAAAMNRDLHAGAEYRAHLVGVMARRAVEAANG